MGFFKDLLGAAAPIVGSTFGPLGAAVGGAIGGAISGSGAPRSTTTSVQNQLDPRAQAILYGDGTAGNRGLLSQYQDMLNTAQDPRLTKFGNANLDYLAQNGGQDIGAVRNTATRLMGGNAAPTMSAASVGAPAWAVGNMVNAPSQNNLNLSSSYDSFINGQAGANPFLTGAIGRGINQSNNAFQAMQQDSTKNLLENVLPSIRGGAIASGQYGSSRQGIAEGRALGDFSTQQQRAISQFGQNNTDAAVAAQAGAYDADRNRQLAATQGLGSQQYGVAQQNAATRNAAEFTNVGQQNATNENYANRLQAANLANLQAQLTTNSQNQSGVLAGAGLLSGLGSSAYGIGTNQDAYALNRAGQVNSLLAPYLSLGGSSTSTQPLYSNTAGNALGGATAALGLYNQFRGSQPQLPQAPAPAGLLPSGWTPSQLPVSSLLSNYSF
jgi:hypothetical protein